MGIGAYRALTISCIGLAIAMAVVTQGEAAPEVLRLLIVPVDFPDHPGSMDFDDMQGDWVNPLVAFWNQVSYGELDLRPTLIRRVSRLSLPRRYYDRSRATASPMGTCAGTTTVACENPCGSTACTPVGRCTANPGLACQSDSTCGGSDTCQYTFGFCSDNTTLCTSVSDCGGSCSLWTGLCTNAPGTSCTSSADCPGTDPDTCDFYWEAWEFDDPIQSLIDDGLIDKSSEGLTPPGAPADQVFDSILFVDAIFDDCATCVETIGDHCLLPGIMWSPRSVKADSEHTYRVGYTSTAFPADACVLEPGEWGVAAHEVGHAAAKGRTHPAGYSSAYELMDSSYPCSPGIYTRVSQDVAGEGYPVWFPGWVPDSKIVTLDPPVGTTELLAPAETDPNATASPMGIKVNVADGGFYIVECRKNPDPANRTSCWTDGLLIQKGATPGTFNSNNSDIVLQMQMPPMWPAGGSTGGRWKAHWRPDDTFSDTFVDPNNDLTITVGPILANGSCTATVTYGPGSTVDHPDMGIIPWLSEPMNTWETVDIWFDSSCNGYEADDPSDPRRLKYGRRVDTTVVGNGDDPCIDHENRVYARVRNLGTAAANEVVVRFERTDPLGVGIRGSQGWALIGSVDKTGPDAACLGSIAPGGFCDVYVPWTPTTADVNAAVAVPLEDARFALHSCVRNRIDAVTGEPGLALANQDGNREQENISYFEARRDPSAPDYSLIEGHIFLFHPQDNLGNGREFILGIDSELPAGWNLEIGDGDAASYFLEPGETLPLPVRIQAPPGDPLGQTYSVQVEAFAKDQVTSPDGARTENYFTRVGGVLMQARTVIDTSMDLSLVIDPPDSCQPTKITAQGCLNPPVAGALLTVDYRGPAGTISKLAETDGAGCFAQEEVVTDPGTWTVQALWQGSDMNSSAVSTEVLAAAFDPADRDCDGLPNTQDPCPDVPDLGIDTDLDGAGDACDCQPEDPTVFAAAPAVPNLDWLDEQTLTWDDLAGVAGSSTVYGLITGELAALPLPGGDGSESCAVSGLASNTYELSYVPPLNSAIWVLAKGSNICGESPLGDGQSGPRQSPACAPCSHGKCTQGGPQDPACDPCVEAICQQDSFCCNTSWDALCVEEVRTVCGSLTCAESAGQCSHTVCSTGTALNESCDDPPVTPSCVSTICSQDSFCCNTSWDSICVGEVNSLCGYNCD